MTPRSSVSLRTLARQLGVSATTVSLALKNSPRVSAEVRARIRRVAKANGYVPNAKLAELMAQARKRYSPRYHATLGAFSLYPEKEPWLCASMGHLRVLLQSATACAEGHGYRLHYFWYREPDMTPQRFAKILEARSIQGLYCLGSLDPEEKYPAALTQFPVTTQGATIPSSLNRITSHFAGDARMLYDQLKQRGYQRPGLFILPNGDRRSHYEYSSTYLSAIERQFSGDALPILRAESWDESIFHRWFSALQPDVIAVHQSKAMLAAMEAYLRQRGLRLPEELGLALLDQNPDPAMYSGMIQDFPRMATVGIEMLIGQIQMRDFAPIKYPKIELVPGQWNEGKTLRKMRR